jgi:hypothetical protein
MRTISKTSKTYLDDQWVGRELCGVELLNVAERLVNRSLDRSV